MIVLISDKDSSKKSNLTDVTFKSVESMLVIFELYIVVIPFSTCNLNSSPNLSFK